MYNMSIHQHRITYLYQINSFVHSVAEMNEKSNFIERKSFHTFHPDSIILPTISIPNGKVRKISCETNFQI